MQQLKLRTQIWKRTRKKMWKKTLERAKETEKRCKHIIPKRKDRKWVHRALTWNTVNKNNFLKKNKGMLIKKLFSLITYCIIQYYINLTNFSQKPCRFDNVKRKHATFHAKPWICRNKERKVILNKLYCLFLLFTDLTLPLSIAPMKVIVYYELYYGNKTYLLTENVIQISPYMLFKNTESLKIVWYSSQEN